MEYPASFNEVLRDIADCIAETLPDGDPETALNIAKAIQRRFGGGLVYIPLGKAYLRERRDAGILKDFDGRNHAELARRYGVTVSTVYEVLKHASKNNAPADRQCPSPPFDQGTTGDGDGAGVSRWR